MFRRLRVRGAAGSLLWGYHAAAVLGRWTIAKGSDGKWRLTAVVTRLEAFQIRQRPLLFTAAREHGWWAWGVESIEIGDRSLVAVLGPPEQ